MPEQPPYERKKDGAEPGTKSAIKTGTSTVEPSVTVTTKKRRFSDSSESSRGSQRTQLASSTTKVTSSGKSSASNHHRNANSKKLSSEPSKPLSANQWEKTAFIGDSDGAKRVKFLRLMGLGKTTAIEAKPESPEEAARDAAKRQQQSADLEKQFEQGRRRRNRFS